MEPSVWIMDALARLVTGSLFVPGINADFVNMLDEDDCRASFDLPDTVLDNCRVSNPHMKNNVRCTQTAAEDYLKFKIAPPNSRKKQCLHIMTSACQWCGIMIASQVSYWA